VFRREERIEYVRQVFIGNAGPVSLMRIMTFSAPVSVRSVSCPCPCMACAALSDMFRTACTSSLRLPETSGGSAERSRTMSTYFMDLWNVSMRSASSAASSSDTNSFSVFDGGRNLEVP